MTPHAPHPQYLERLARVIARQVTADELDWLVMTLGLGPLPQRTRRARARAVVAAAQRAGRIEELREALRELRPYVPWPRPPGKRGGSARPGPVTVYQIGEVHTEGGAFFGGQVTAGGDAGLTSKTTTN
ncbi:MAG: hypothetical protein KA170_15745 [Candidatus Promineofilum sp.]|nr:hypothetical protein [Promineifilum sp.]